MNKDYIIDELYTFYEKGRRFVSTITYQSVR